jgi:hypothetical protein
VGDARDAGSVQDIVPLTLLLLFYLRPLVWKRHGSPTIVLQESGTNTPQGGYCERLGRFFGDLVSSSCFFRSLEQPCMCCSLMYMTKLFSAVSFLSSCRPYYRYILNHSEKRLFYHNRFVACSMLLSVIYATNIA